MIALRHHLMICIEEIKQHNLSGKNYRKKHSHDYIFCAFHGGITMLQ